jgi:hypothetical protein
MHQQSNRQLQERTTALTVPDVLSAAIRYFSRRGGVYSAFVEKQSANHVALRGQGGEEIVIAARTVPEGTSVSGASYLFDQQVAQFLASLPSAPQLAPAALVEAVASDAPASVTAAGAV